MLRGMPTIVTLRGDTLAFFPGLRTEVETRSYYYQRTLAEAAEHPEPARPWRDGSFGVSPAQLCALHGVERRAECMPHVLLFARITGLPNRGGVHDLAPGEATARLRRVLLSAALAKQTSDLITLPDDPPAPDPERVEEVIRAFAARVPCLECRLGSRSYESGALAAECRRLLAA
jgi:hypothetical protein